MNQSADFLLNCHVHRRAFLCRGIEWRRLIIRHALTVVLKTLFTTIAHLSLAIYRKFGCRCRGIYLLAGEREIYTV